SADLGDNLYHKKVVNFSGVELEDGQTPYITFGYRVTTNWYWYVDDVTVDLIPACAEPSQLSAIPVSNSADVTWNGNSDGYNLYYRLAGSTDEYTEEENVSLDDNGIYTIEDLTPMTTYQWYVAAICDDGSFSNSEVSTFTTACVALTELPYTCDFETVGTETNPVPQCWTKGNGNTTYPYVNNSSSNAYAGSRYLYFYNANTIALPLVDTEVIDLTETQVSFYAKGSGYVLQVGVMTNPTDASTFTQVGSVTLTSDYELYELPLSSYEGEGAYVAIRNTSNNYIYLDNLSLELIPSCSRPSNLSASTVDDDIELSWESTADSFILYYRVAGSSDYEEVEVNGTTYTLTGLSSSTSYQWYVKSICGDDTDPQSSVASFSTPCDLVTSLPITWDFETYDQQTLLPSCWLAYNRTNSNEPKVNTDASNARNGNGYLYLYQHDPNSIIVLPPVDTDIYPINTLQVRFWGKHTPNYDWAFGVQIGVMTDLNDPSTFVEVDTICIGRVQDYTEYVLSLASYEGDGQYVALRCNSVNTVMWARVDDMTLESTIGEQDPIEPTVVTNDATNIAQTTATLNGAITSAGNQTITARGFEWKATVGGTYTTVSATGTTMTANLTGLTANTSYTYRAFATTGNGTQYGSEVTFTTLEAEQPIEPTVVTNVATNIAQTTATLNGAITEVGNQTITARGFEWKATVGGTYTSVSATGTTMTYALSGLTANTSYTYKAFATTANGTQYGDEVTFTTLEAGEEPCTPATATLNETVCFGETFTFNGNTYTTTGIYTTTVAGANGECDTNYTINLTVNAQNTATETITVCYGETAEFNGQALTEGENTVTVAGQGNECDTLYTVTLVVRPENTNTVEVSINPDEVPYQFGTQVLETEGTYTEVFTDENGCDSTVTLNLTINSGINDVENGINVMLYPNPTTEDAMLRVEGINSDATIYVTDVQGRTIKETKLAQGENTLRIETSTFASGVYYIRIVTDTTNHTEKLIKK
ncbi:MAG: fibronectin type III domain-containing protein, partial [Bacteroidales bacterium]|nr:fibronectin type III domain-containing protein [Bacteroidales bacterium]